MKYLLVCSFLGFLLLFFATSDVTTELFKPEQEVFKNPLDLILGEKVLDNGTLRKDNFDSILQIKASFLSDSSEIYKIEQLNANLFLLVRKKSYFNTRNYSLFVKIKGNTIVNYYSTTDFSANSKNTVLSGNRIYLLSNDFNSGSSNWKSSYMVRLTCFDLDFNEIWRTTFYSN
jgi:hypothetical protein